MPSAPHRVVALALPGVVLLDLAAPTHLFGHCGSPQYSFRLAGLAAGNVRSSTGFDVVAPAGVAALDGADTVVVPGVDAPVADPVALSSAASAVAAAHRRGARVMSICTGAFVLAEAGLLDGRRATTHWGSAAELARRYPAVQVQPDVLYVDQGDVLTSAGVAAGLDLCLHVIRSDHGAALAAKLARRTVIAPHRDGGQRQFAPPDRHEPLAGRPAPSRRVGGRWSTWRSRSGSPPWPARRACRRGRSCAGFSPRPVSRPDDGCPSSGPALPRSCWRRPNCRSSTSRSAAASAARRPCAPISAARSG